MSWDIILFNSKQKIDSVDTLDETQLEPTNFSKTLEDSSESVLVDDNHREIQGEDYSIGFFIDDEPKSKTMVFLHGENGLFMLIELAKKHGWQIFDTSLDSMIDLNDPSKNGYLNYRKYVEVVMNKKND